MSEFIPPLMAELCAAARMAVPTRNDARSRHELMLRLNRLDNEGWDALPEAGQAWLNAAIAAYKGKRDLPDFVGAGATDGPAPPTADASESKMRRIVRCIVTHHDLIFEEAISRMYEEYGVRYRNVNEIYSKKSQVKTVLEILSEEGMLNERGEQLLRGRLMRRRGASGPTGRERPRARDRQAANRKEDSNGNQSESESESESETAGAEQGAAAKGGARKRTAARLKRSGDQPKRSVSRRPPPRRPRR